MKEIIEIALKYGGYTSLDRTFLMNQLAGLPRHQQLAFITPPPSVVNAYFAELYQKKGVEEACHYYQELSDVYDWYTEAPSFKEEAPFVRLNLNGRAFGFAYRNKEGEAIVFSEQDEPVTTDLLFEIAQIFPCYLIYEEDETIRMKPVDWTGLKWMREGDGDERFVLSQLERAENWIKISGYNQDEVLERSQSYAGKRYISWSGREARVYIES
ncbi:hypothetical protein [Streptococcus sp. DD13]|uniref:hypothetical protein n=1 Tax=Streptococcus sp. DD13 TaxID=1777881 RepID=UPI00082BDEC3